MFCYKIFILVFLEVLDTTKSDHKAIAINLDLSSYTNTNLTRVNEILLKFRISIDLKFCKNFLIEHKIF